MELAEGHVFLGPKQAETLTYCTRNDERETRADFDRKLHASSVLISSYATQPPLIQIHTRELNRDVHCRAERRRGTRNAEENGRRDSAIRIQRWGRKCQAEWQRTWHMARTRKRSHTILVSKKQPWGMTIALRVQRSPRKIREWSCLNGRTYTKGWE